MEPDALKAAWRTLDARLARHDDLQLELLRAHRLDAARRGLRPLVWGQVLQMALGIGLIVLGVACWTRNLHVPGLFATGLVLHAFGVLTTALAGLVLALAGTIDYTAPVTKIQRRMDRLLRLQSLNSNACGAPWWIMWLLVVVGFAGTGHAGATARTPAWIAWSLGIGVAGLLATWAWAAWRARHGDEARTHGDGTDGIRRGRRMIEDLRKFETE